MPRRVFGADWRIAITAALILILAAGAVFHSRAVYGPGLRSREAIQTDRYCEAAKNANNGKYTKECEGFWALTFEDPIALYTFALTVATTFLVIATSGLWYAAIRQSHDTREAIASSQTANDIALQALEAGQRPWLGFEHFGPNEIRLGFNHLKFKIPIQVRNYGPVPAASVHFGCVMVRSESGTDVWNTLRGLAKIAMRKVEKTPSNPIIVFPDKTQSMERNTKIEFSGAEIDRQQIALFANYYIILTYRHPLSSKVYCTATGYGFMRENCPTYSITSQSFDISDWLVHVMPGCNLIT